MAARTAFIEEIRHRIARIAATLSGNKDIVDIVYRPRLAMTDPADCKEAVQSLRAERAREIKMGATVLGPHRDMINLIISKIPLRNYGSMGQKKSVMMAMKLAALETLSQHRGEPAILILDEAFAILDRERSRSLLGLLSDAGQVFLASASMRGLKEADNLRVFDIMSGTVIERSN
jgi:DNA replication and repair protein RecF